MTLSPELVRRYREELDHRPSESFDEEYARTTDVERMILMTHGHDGAAFLIERQGALVGPGPGCPWSLSGDPRAAIRTIFAPLAGELEQFLGALTQRVMFVIPFFARSSWRLAYVVDRALHDGRASYELVVGGAPNLAPELEARATSLGWIVPRSIQRLYAVHDGLGPWDEIGGAVPSAGLCDLGHIMDPICESEGFKPSGYAFQDLLEFSPDGGGNSQCFFRSRPGDPDPSTVDRDHETRELSDAIPFFEYLDERLLGLVLDEE